MGWWWVSFALKPKLRPLLTTVIKSRVSVSVSVQITSIHFLVVSINGSRRKVAIPWKISGVWCGAAGVVPHASDQGHTTQGLSLRLID